MSYGQQRPSYGQGYGPPQYPPPGYGFPPTGPREHPSAATALKLGLGGVFCLGALLGVPAILTGRRVLEAVRREPQLWIATGNARIGIVLGWMSVVETALFLTMAVTKSVPLGLLYIGLAIVGLTVLALSAVQALPKPVATVSGVLRRAPLAVGLSLAGVLAGAGFGLVGVITAEQEEAQKCAVARGQYDGAMKKEEFGLARAAINQVKSFCHAADAEIGPLRASVDAREADARKRKDEEEKAKAAQAAADKEKTAVETFPEQSKQVAAQIKKAQSLTWQGKWEDADDILTTATGMLDVFKGTSVEQSKGFTDLVTQIATQRKTLQPQLDKIAEKRRQEEATAALRAAIRGPKPQNSAWDGSVSAVERAIKANMHDADSYEHVRTTTPVVEGDYWVVISSFRGKNVFGAKVINTKKFYIQQGQVVKMSDVGGDDD